jgi:ABC-type glycerol-3-phosphate transport system permease component
MNFRSIYISSNVCFALLVLICGAVHDRYPLDLIYLIALFAICSSSFSGMRRLNDRYMLLVVFSLVYFMFYGVDELTTTIFGSKYSSPTSGHLNVTHIVILVGAALAQLGYRMICNSSRTNDLVVKKDWPERSMIIAGGLLWIVCTWLTWQFKVNIVVSTFSADVSRGLGGLNSWQTSAFILAIMLQPLGILIVAYAQSKFKRAYMTPLLLGVVLFQLFMGFVTDVKADALSGALIVLVTKLVVDGSIPKKWLVATVVFIVLAFPILQANRAVRGMGGIDRSEAAKGIGEIVKKAVQASNEESPHAEQQQSFFERLSLVGSVHTIVSRTGMDRQFQKGYTLTPLVTTFIPRIVWPSKPDVQTGRVMNKEFQISPVADTYISPSHLGELYWNFGWAGVIVGMLLIGSLLGYVGSRFNFENATTITSLMMVMVTVRLIIVGFEGTIAVQYSVWMRSMLAIGLLHLAFAKVIAISRVPAASGEAQDSAFDKVPPKLPGFANLMR